MIFVYAASHLLETEVVGVLSAGLFAYKKAKREFCSKTKVLKQCRRKTQVLLCCL